MVDVVLPVNSSVILEPAEAVKFRLQRDAEPQAVLSICNVSEDAPIAFKVKTKRPDSYLVRPHQGILDPNRSASITLILRQEECNELLQLDANGRESVADKFLIQSVEVDQSFHDRAKWTDEVVELSRIWAQVDSQLVSNKKLRCCFVVDPEDEAQQLRLQLGRLRDAPPDTSQTAFQTTTSGAVSTQPQLSAALLQSCIPPEVETCKGGKYAVQDVTVPRKKYEESVALIAQLTAQRDALVGRLAKTQQQLQKATVDAERAKWALEEANDNVPGEKQKRWRFWK